MRTSHVLILALSIIIAGFVISRADVGVGVVTGCQVGLLTTSIATGQTIPLTCDLTGKLRVTTTF